MHKNPSCFLMTHYQVNIKLHVSYARMKYHHCFHICVGNMFQCVDKVRKHVIGPVLPVEQLFMSISSLLHKYTSMLYILHIL
jgi:hypothetical protein